MYEIDNVQSSLCLMFANFNAQLENRENGKMSWQLGLRTTKARMIYLLKRRESHCSSPAPRKGQTESHKDTLPGVCKTSDVIKHDRTGLDVVVESLPQSLPQLQHSACNENLRFIMHPQ